MVAVSVSAAHEFRKRNQSAIRLIAGEGVAGDAHAGVTVKHRSRVARDPLQPNLRQVYLIHRELFRELAEKGLTVGPGEMGENITTSGVDLLALPTGARLHLGESAVIEVTGLRNPCGQLDQFQRGLTAALLARAGDGSLIRKAGVMAIVVTGGDVRPGDAIKIELPPMPHTPLAPV